MSSQRSGPEAGSTQAAHLTLASLPRALQCEVFARVPVDARARCAAVCKAWCEVLLERSLWTRLDLSPAGGVAEERVTDALLRGAAAKARGGLTALNVTGCDRLTHDALLEVVTANAGALTELHACRSGVLTTTEQVEALLVAAPLLRVCHVNVVHAAAAAAFRMLRNEPPFGPLRLRTLEVQPPWPGGEADVRALAADMTASASSLWHLKLMAAPLAGHGALGAVVDAALVRRLTILRLVHCRLCAASVPALARLLGGSALKVLYLQHAGDEPPLLLSGAEGSAAVLAAALRANNTLTALGLAHANVWHDAAAAETLLHALTAHPSLQTFHLFHSPVGAADRARAGASFGALVAANAPALTQLDVSQCALGDEGLGPLMDALAANTHLRHLICAGNDMSDAFAEQRLQPALLANTSLRMLMLRTMNQQMLEDGGGAVSPALRQLEQLVAQRAAAA
jgi:hypothetical protein